MQALLIMLTSCRYRGEAFVGLQCSTTFDHVEASYFLTAEMVYHLTVERLYQATSASQCVCGCNPDRDVPTMAGYNTEFRQGIDIKLWSFLWNHSLRTNG